MIAEQEAPNFFRAVGSFFARPGDWEVEVDLRRREVDDVSAYFSVPVVGAAAVDGDGRFDIPLVAGSWVTVGVVGSLVGGLLSLGGCQSLAGPTQVNSSTTACGTCRIDNGGDNVDNRRHRWPDRIYG